MLNFLSLAFACGMTACLGAGVNYINEEKQDESVNFHLDNKKMVSYDDENYKITLSADELTDYVFNNFSHALALFDIEELIDEYYSFSFKYGEYSSGTALVSVTYPDTQNSRFTGHISDYLIDNVPSSFGFNVLEQQSKFVLFNDYSGVEVPLSFSYSVVMTFDSAHYSDLKSAIELDIQANQQETGMVVVLGDFVEILVSGITGLATGIAGGIVSMASSLFLEVNDGVVTGLSVFGGIVAIFAGLALAVSITTKVYLWVTSLGN